MNNQERKKCGKCRVNLLLKEYKERRNGNLTATCIKCLEYRREYNKRYKDYDKEYYENNKEKQKEYNKEYREEHKEEIKEYNKEYNKRPDVRERNRKYQNERNKERFKCDCGSVNIRKGDIRKHERTKRHIRYVENTKEQRDIINMLKIDELK